MAEIQNISEIHPTLGFTEFDILEKYCKSFNESELGRLHSVFPFERMAKVTGLSLRKVLRSELSRERASRLDGSSALKSNITRYQG